MKIKDMDNRMIKYTSINFADKTGSKAHDFMELS